MLDDQLISQLVDRAKADGIQLTGEGGLLQLTKRILESALAGELTDHPGHEKHEKAGSGNVGNGTRSKTVITDVGSALAGSRWSSGAPNAPAAPDRPCCHSGGLSGGWRLGRFRTGSICRRDDRW